MANEKFDRVLSNVLVELDSPDESKQAAASAVVAVLLTQAPEGRTLSPTVVPAVFPLLVKDNVLIQVTVVHQRSSTHMATSNHRSLLQRNACAALIAVAELEAAMLQVEMPEWNQAVPTNRKAYHLQLANVFKTLHNCVGMHCSWRL